MPVYRVTSPDGRTFDVNAPEGATQDDAVNWAKQNIKAPTVPVEGQNPVAADVRDQVNFRAPHTTGEKFHMGVGDVGLGALQNAAHIASVYQDPDTLVPEDQTAMRQQIGNYAKSIDARLAQREAQWQNERARSIDAQGNRDTGAELMRATGAALTAAPVTALFPESAATTFPRIAATSIGQGAFTSAMAPVTDPSAPFGISKAKQMGEGGGLGFLTDMAFRGAGRVIRPQVDPNVQMLVDRGVNLTPGQAAGRTAATAEEKAASIPLIGDAIRGGQRGSIQDYNRAWYNEVLSPLGMQYQGPVGHQAVREIGDTIGKEYDNLVPKLSFTMDAPFAADMQSISNFAQNMTNDSRDQFTRILRSELGDRLAKGGGTLDGQNFRAIEENLGRLRTNFATGNANERMVGDALGQTVDALRDGLERSNPDYARQLTNINDAYRRLVVLERAAGNSTKSDGVFSPEVALNAVKAEDRSARKRGTSRGTGTLQDLASAGYQVLGGKYPDSGTAGRAMMGGALLSGGAATINPVAGVAAGLGMLGYTPQGRQALTTMFVRRPQIAQPIAQTTRALAPYASSGLIFGMGQ